MSLGRKGQGCGVVLGWGEGGGLTGAWLSQQEAPPHPTRAPARVPGPLSPRGGLPHVPRSGT